MRALDGAELGAVGCDSPKRCSGGKMPLESVAAERMAADQHRLGLIRVRRITVAIVVVMAAKSKGEESGLTLDEKLRWRARAAVLHLKMCQAPRESMKR